MPKILPILSRSILPLLSVGLISFASARAPGSSNSVAVDSVLNTGKVPPVFHPVPDSITTGRIAQRARSDSAVAADSMGRMVMPSFVGTLDRSMDSSKYYTQESLHWIDYKSLGGILETYPGVYVRTQSSAGQYDQPNIRGYDWRGIAVLSNGRLMNDPASDVYNLFQFPSEYVDRAEIITGPRAFLYGLNSTAGAINLVTKNYNSNRPFTKFNYSQAPYDYEYSDGTFSQNLSRKLNLTFGFQHQSTSGRFANSAHEAWDIRTKVRYLISQNLTMILSGFLISSTTEMNGGVADVDVGLLDAFDPRGATLRNTDSYEKVTRHDIDLSLVGTLFGDTTNVSLLTLYYSRNLREYRDEENRPSPNGIFIQSDHTSSWMGALLTQNFSSNFQRASFGATLELRQIEGSPNLGRRRNTIGAAWVKEDLLLGQAMVVSGFARYDRYLKSAYAGIGTDATLHVGSTLSLFGGFSHSRRLPTYEELYWTDSTVSRAGELQAETHIQAEAGAELDDESIGTLRIAYFHRTVKDVLELMPYGSGHAFPGVMYSNNGTVATNGVEARLTARLSYMYLEGTATYLTQKSGAGSSLEYLPSLTANGGLYFWGKVPGVGLHLKSGFRGRYTSSQIGELFNPEILAYRDNTGKRIGRGGTLDFILIAHIGDAYIHFMWENITNAQFFSTPYYPVLDRAIRFGVSWEFLN